MHGTADNFSGEAVSDGKAKKVSANQTTNGQKSPLIFRRIAAADMTAVRECIDVHGNLVWALAKKLTRSNEKAEAAAQEIFLGLWKYASCFDEAKMSEENFIIFVAYRCLTKGKEELASESEEIVI